MPETTPRELVERLREGAADLHGFCVDEVEVPSINVALPAYLREAATALSAALDRVEKLEADNIRLRLEVAESVSEEDYEKLLAVRRVEIDANNACHEEINRLRGLLEEAKGVIGTSANLFLVLTKPDMSVSSDAVYFRCVEARSAASSLLKRLEDATSTPSGQ